MAHSLVVIRLSPPPPRAILGSLLCQKRDRLGLRRGACFIVAPSGLLCCCRWCLGGA